MNFDETRKYVKGMFEGFNVNADLLSVNGFGGTRYYNNKWQYYDVSSSTWVDMQATANNVAFTQMKPANLKTFLAVNQSDTLGKVYLYIEGQDTIINGQAICYFDKVKIVRKLGAAPTSESDGNLVVTVNRRNMRKYKENPYVDLIPSPVNDGTYYYKAFIYGTSGFVNDIQDISVEVKDYTLFGYSVDSEESDPSDAVSYDVDYVTTGGDSFKVDNVDFDSANMNYSSGSFNYGSWKNAFFMPRPCMLKTDGTVDYYLKENDYTKKEDGTDSDVANASYDGNAMMEWGRNGKRIWYKIVGTNDDNTSYNVYFCDKQLDTDFVAWSFYNKDDVLGEHFYTPIYSGSLSDNKLRSLSGKNLQYGYTATQQIAYAKNNSDYWNIEVWSDKLLMFLLLYMMGKSLDLQTIYGIGHTNGTSASTIKSTGELNTKGLFWGSNTQDYKVKVFGMEDQWGEQWNRICGLMLNNGTYYIKYTEGIADGTTSNEYRITDVNGMFNCGDSPKTNGLISEFRVEGNSILPNSANASTTTYYCDWLSISQSGLYFGLVGFPHDDNSNTRGLRAGFGFNLFDYHSYTSWVAGASLSCKPLLATS